MTILPLNPTTYAATCRRRCTPSQLMARLRARLPLPLGTCVDLLTRPTGALLLVHLPHPLVFDALSPALAAAGELLSQGVPVELRLAGALWCLSTPSAPLSAPCLRVTYPLLLTLFPYFPEKSE